MAQARTHINSHQMTPTVFLLLNLVLAFYNVGTIWAHEVDIFRTWKLINPDKVHTAHWRKLPYWIFTPVALVLCGGVALVWYHPTSSPVWPYLTKILATHWLRTLLINADALILLTWAVQVIE